MTATAASSPWPAPPSPPDRGVWRIGRVLEHGAGGPVLEWALRRNCSLTPRQLLMVYLSMCTVSLAIAGVFGALGASPVVVFAGIELLVLGIALLVYARHAADRETITLRGEALCVEHCCGSNVARAEFRAAWVRVEPVHGDGSLLELSGQGRSVRVGRYLRPDLRTPLAHELRRALRDVPMSPAT